jgi:hypothetical protein
MPEPAHQQGTRKGALRSFRIGLFLLAGCFLACMPPAPAAPVEVRLYDLTATRVLLCDLSLSGRAGSRGAMATRTGNGEAFHGEWVELPCVTDSAPSPSGFDASLPTQTLPRSPVNGSWDWARDLGIDFDHFPDSYCSFTLLGDPGTLINGFFVENESTNGLLRRALQGELFHRKFKGAGLLGAAKDNRGHRYRLMG